MSVKKITYEEYKVTYWTMAWAHIEALQTELTRLESMVQGRGTMTVDEIVKHLCDKSDDWCKLQGWEQKEIARHIQDLTVPQGFVVDWSNEPEWVGEIVILRAEGKYPYGHSEMVKHIPHPTPVKRMRTREEKERLLDPFIGDWSQHIIDVLDDKSIDKLCTAAGISLETDEPQR